MELDSDVIGVIRNLYGLLLWKDRYIKHTDEYFIYKSGGPILRRYYWQLNRSIFNDYRNEYYRRESQKLICV